MTARRAFAGVVVLLLTCIAALPQPASAPTRDAPPPVRLAASEVGGGAVTRINPVVDQLMAGITAVVGGGTILRYAGDVALLPTSVRGQSSWFVHRQCRGHEQHHQGGTGAGHEFDR